MRTNARGRSLLERASAAAMAGLALWVSASHVGMNEARKWIDNAVPPSTPSKDEQATDMQWFVDAANPLERRTSILQVHRLYGVHEFQVGDSVPFCLDTQRVPVFDEFSPVFGVAPTVA